MWIAIQTFFAMLWASPVTKKIVAQTVEDLTKAGMQVVDVAVPAVKNAAALDCSGKEKAMIVLDEVKRELPGVATSLAENVITSVYRAIKTDPTLGD